MACYLKPAAAATAMVTTLRLVVDNPLFALVSVGALAYSTTQWQTGALALALESGCWPRLKV